VRRWLTGAHNILDDRFQSLTVEYVTVKDLERARSTAGEGLLFSPHHKAVTDNKDGIELFRIDRCETDGRIVIT
jgi:hypothetical protein